MSKLIHFRRFVVTDQNGIEGVGVFSSSKKRMRNYSVDWANGSMSNLDQEAMDRLRIEWIEDIMYIGEN